MPFDPEAYLEEKPIGFDPEVYLNDAPTKAFDPEEYLNDAPTKAFDPEEYLSGQDAPASTVKETVADVGLSIASGMNTGIRMISDAFGANNPVSVFLSSNEKFYSDLLSASAKDDQQKIAALMKEAEDKGVVDQVKAGLKAFTEAPLITTSQAAGTIVPTLLAGAAVKALRFGAAGKALGFGAKGISMITGAVGGVMGAGATKSSIHDEVKAELIKGGISEQQAETAADEAQRYKGKNLDQILIGTGLGVVAARTGAEGVLSRVLGKSGTPVTRGLIASVLRGGITEAIPEAVQGGQEKLAANVALQREGIDTPTMRGVVSRGTLEGAAAGPLGGISGGFDVSPDRVEAPPPNPVNPETLNRAKQELANNPELTEENKAELQAFIDNNDLPGQQEQTEQNTGSDTSAQNATNESSPDAPATIEQRKQAVTKNIEVAQMLLPGVKIETVDNLDQLPPDIRKRIGLDENEKPEGFFDIETGRVFIVGDNISQDRVIPVALHEAAGHKGIRATLGEDRMETVFGQVYDGMSEEQRQTLVDSGYDAKDTGVLGEEHMARLAENPDIDPTAWARVVASVRQVLRDMGFVGTMTDADIQALVYSGIRTAQGKGKRRAVVGKADYMAAVERGDMVTAQRMVDEAAKRVGYNVGPVYRSDSDNPTVFDPNKPKAAYDNGPATLFTPNIELAKQYGEPRLFYLSINNPQEENVGRGYKGGHWSSVRGVVTQGKSNGRDGVIIRDVSAGGSPELIRGDIFGVFSPNQIKSADPITRDAQGRVIPLSERFSEKSNDIRFSKTASMYMKAVESGDTKAAQKMVADDGKDVRLSRPTESKALDELLKEIRTQEKARGKRMRGLNKRVAIAEEPLVDPNNIIESERSYYKTVSIRQASESVEAMTPKKVRSLAGGLKSGEVNYVTALAAIRVINEDAAAGLDVQPMIDRLAEAGTAAGQFIRMFAELKQKSPPALIAAIEQQMAKKKRFLRPEQKVELTNLIQADFDARDAVRAAQEKAFSDPLNTDEIELGRLDNEAEAASYKMMRYAARMMPKSGANIFTQLIQGNLLVPISQARNLGSNIQMQLIRDVEQSIAAVGDSVLSFVTGSSRTVAFPSIAGRVIGAVKGTKQGVKELFTGAAPGKDIHGEYNLRGFQPIEAWKRIFDTSRMPVNKNGKVSFGDYLKNVVEGTIGIPAEINFRLLGLGDHPFRLSTYESVIREQAKLRGLKGKERAAFLKRPDAAAYQIAVTESLESVYQNQNAAAGAIRNLTKVRVPIIGEWIEALALKPIMPYVQTPINLAHIGFQLASPEYSGARAMWFFAQSISSTDPAMKSAFKRKALMSAARSGVATIMYAGAAALVQAGLVNGNDDDKKKTSLQYKLGFPPNAINVTGLKRLLDGGDPTWQAGDETQSLYWYGFFGLNALIAANSKHEAEKDGGTWDAEVFFRTPPIAELASAMLEMTVLKGASEILNAISNKEYDRWYKNYASVVTSAVLPNSLAAFNRSKQGTLIDLRGTPKGFINAMRVSVQERNPFINMNDIYPYRRDPLGQAIKRTPDGAQPWMYHLFDPSKSQTITDDPVWIEIGRLYYRVKASPDKVFASTANDVIPSNPARVAKGSAVKPFEYENMMELVGDERMKRVKAIMNDPRYADATDKKKVEALKRAYTKGAKVGRDRFLNAQRVSDLHRPTSYEEYLMKKRKKERLITN